MAQEGALRGPTLSLSRTSAQPGDSVQLLCSVFFKVPATRIIFCKDGEEVSSQKGLEKKAVYNYHYAVSRDSSGNYSCGYEIKDSDNQVTRSLLSPSQHLSVTGDDSSSSGVGGSAPQGLVLLGITIPAVLVLAVVLYLLGKKVASLLRDQREQAQHGTSNTPEDHIEYASVNWVGSTKHPRPQREETPTYATIGLQRDRCH
ncbi:uncharacterized protein LOC120395110 [Mauremys reevesii]|uniref:uncharacterized protein LOC120395110 n=1 Tax=Mauremys reevesii TaxID=260615 RepID=UPI00193FA2CB|nr:uncharacterized protein LOC120395110 [Mauremys reevesii]